MCYLVLLCSTAINRCCLYRRLIDFFFFFKQKTAYEMRISDWSSDVCSSDLAHVPRQLPAIGRFREAARDSRRRRGLRGKRAREIGRASCRERVCQYV